jgi:copper homeostasis protein
LLKSDASRYSLTAQRDRVLVEVCVGSFADVEAARDGGADRLELCSALELGGLTPSLGLVESALATADGLPVITMVRPRAGGFCYDSRELAVMARDVESLLDRGAAGIAFGVLTSDGRIDLPRCRELVGLAGNAQTVFHRAFDLVAEQDPALEQLIDLGVTRVLTSGGCSTAMEGAGAIRRLVERAAGRIEILAGGGIRAEHAADLITAAGCRELHIGAAVARDDGTQTSRRGVQLSDSRIAADGRYRAVDGAQVAAIVRAARTF